LTIENFFSAFSEFLQEHQDNKIRDGIMTKTKWGILGCSDFARRRAIPAMLEAPSVNLVAIASRTPDKAERFRAAFNLPRAYDQYEKLLLDSEIQVIYIPLPNSMHAEWAVKAAEAGKHSLCEKPFACTAEEAEKAALAASSRGVHTAEAFMWRFHAQHEKAREIVESGAIGPIRLLRMGFSFVITRDSNIRLLPELGGGCLMDLGCYVVSAARFYFGTEPKLVYARADFDPVFKVDTKVSAILEFAAGRVIMDCSFDLPQRRQLEIHGEQGTIAFAQPWQPEPDAVIYVDGKPQRFARQNHYVTMFEHFSQCFAKGSTPRYASEDAVTQMRVLDAIRRSIATGLPQTLTVDQ
jgi:predicted dehydrogenase